MKRRYFSRRMSKTWLIPIVLFALVILGLFQYIQLQRETEMPFLVQSVKMALVDEPIQPLPLTATLDPGKVRLGEQLFKDPRLSANNTISCASCHNLKLAGTDRSVVSIGIHDKPGFMNTPTVFNSRFNFKQFWDGRAETLEEQIDGPIHASYEMASNWPDIIRKLKHIPAYVSMFKALYAGKIDSDNIKDAIATFERSLTTPNSHFDQFLAGDETALTTSEQEGYRRFKAYGCVTCHQGINIGGNMFQGFGVFGDYFKDRGNETRADFGRYNITGNERDRYVFKVPGLRNVALTAPYFHDGSAKTLTDAVKIMGKYQLGRQLSAEDVDLIVDFLTALTGKYRGEPL